MRTPGASFMVRVGLLFVALLLPRPAVAAWPDDPLVNVPLSTAISTQTYPTSVPDGAGGAIVTWQDYRSGVSDIYAQRISAGGTAQWTVDGVAICGATGNQGGPTIASDGAGGAIITWADMRSSVSYDIYAQRISASGTVQWAVDGVALCTATNSQYYPTIVSDGVGGAIVTWQDYRSGTSDIYVQRISASGTVQWQPTGVLVCRAVGNQNYPTIAMDGVGGAIVSWQDARSGTEDIYAQRISALGAAQWTGDGVALCIVANPQTRPVIVSDDTGGAVVTWQDYRSGNNDIYAQRISAGGLVQWMPNGAALCVAASEQAVPTIVSDGAGGAIVTWQDNRSGNNDIYAQRISAGGLVQWTANGAALCVVAGNQVGPTIASDDAGGAVVTWEDSRGSYSDIYVQRISATGAVQWTANGVVLCAAAYNQETPTVVSAGAGGAIVSWEDQRSGNSDIYAQRIGGDGVLVGVQPTILSVLDVSSDQGGKIRIKWEASYLDRPTLGLSIYGIWRQISGAAALKAVAAGAKSASSSCSPAAAEPRTFRTTESGAKAIYWEGVGTVAGRSYPTYTFTVLTFQDSTAAANPYSVFMVDFQAAQWPGYWASEPDSGYSVDNLAPAQPAPFTGKYLVSATALHWGLSTAPDLAGYQIYRGDSADFIPGPANFVVAKPDTGYVDQVAGIHYYKLCAVDIHGNPSPYALLTPQQTTPASGTTSAALRLYQNAPNPFNPRTTIRFDLPAAGTVRLAVYDVAGRLVRVLVDGDLPGGSHDAIWDGRDAAGRATPSGSYLARLEAGRKVEVVRMGLVR